MNKCAEKLRRAIAVDPEHPETWRDRVDMRERDTREVTAPQEDYGYGADVCETRETAVASDVEGFVDVRPNDRCAVGAQGLADDFVKLGLLRKG